MKKVTSIRLHIIFMAVAGLVGMHNLNAITDAEIVMLVKQKKAKIKPEELGNMYQDFLKSIKDEFIAREIKKIESGKEKWKSMNIAMSAKQQPQLSKKEVIREFESNWDSKRDAESHFRLYLGYQEPQLMKAMTQMKDAVIDFDPVIDFVKVVLGYEIDGPSLLGSSEPEIRQYKEDYKTRLYQWLKNK